jgi:hypothetical protein
VADLASGGDFDGGGAVVCRIPIRRSELFYPGGISETEILIVYGSASFASKMGALAGNHFITITEGRERLPEFGEYVLWHGAQDITFSSIS